MPFVAGSNSPFYGNTFSVIKGAENLPNVDGPARDARDRLCMLGFDYALVVWGERKALGFLCLIALSGRTGRVFFVRPIVLSVCRKPLAVLNEAEYKQRKPGPFSKNDRIKDGIQRTAEIPGVDRSITA